ncbi:Uncharacterized integral membrane protein [Actinobacillus equuli]|nr:Uncharacterized integral membrane protein [Actinobacillus equuli]
MLYFNLPLMALGAMLFTIGGLSYKEYFCFRVFGLNFQPILMAVFWFAVVFEQNILLQLFSIVCGLLLLILSIQNGECRCILILVIKLSIKYKIINLSLRSE